MAFLKNILSYIFHYMFGSYRDSTVEQIAESTYDTTTLHVRSLKGVTIRFYCKKNNFVIKNNHPYVPDYKFSVYMLYGECNSECPEKLKKVLQKVSYFPTLRPWFTSEHNRRRFLIETYIGLLSSDLMTLK